MARLCRRGLPTLGETQSAPALAIDDQIWSGLQALIDDYIEVNDDDDIVIAYTPDSRTAAVWVCLAFRDRDFQPSLVPMAPLFDKGFYSRLRSVIPERRSKPGKCVCLLFELHT